MISLDYICSYIDEWRRNFFFVYSFDFIPHGYNSLSLDLLVLIAYKNLKGTVVCWVKSLNN